MRAISEIQNGKRVIIKKPELLAPAGSIEKLKVAILYGADAVFVGGKEFSLRSNASNFTLDDIKEAVEFANEHGASIHVTCNIILHDDNLEGIKEYLLALDKIGVAAIIVADLHIVDIAKSLNLELEVHISTQLSTLNSSAVEFYKQLGVERVVLAREVDYTDLSTIRKACDIDLEYFIHGAMCIHYSGRCMLSNYFSRRDANRGGCSQSCRWYYQMKKDGEVLSDEITPFSMSSKDMALIDHLPKLIELGIDSFKIEGRMKSLHYVATVVSAYRKLIDDYCANPDEFVYNNKYKNQLLKAANRAVSTGFFTGVSDRNGQLFNQRNEHPTQEFVLRILHYNADTKMALVEQRNYFKVGDKVEIFSPSHEPIVIEITKIVNEDNEVVEVANHPMELLYVYIEHEVYENDMGRLL